MPKDITFEKLKGRENFAEWKRSMLAFLRTRKLAKCVDPAPNTETDADKLSEAMGWLYLACDPAVSNHFDDASTPLEIWNLLSKSFAESGLDREVAAIVSLVSTHLDDCGSIDEYIGRIMEAWMRCKDAKITIEDRLVALLMIGRLGTKYQPFVMGLSASGMELTVENVKASLLSLVPTSGGTETAFIGSGGRSKASSKSRRTGGEKKPIKCYGCGQIGHYRNKCPDQDRSSSGGASSGGKPTEAKFANAFSAFADNRHGDDWFIDSGASRSMTPRRDFLTDFKQISHPDISVANSERLRVHGSGTAHITIDGVDIAVRNVLFVPDLGANLLSVAAMTKAGNRVTFDAVGCSVYNPRGDLLIKARSTNGVFKIDAKHIHCMLAKGNEVIEWHRRLGHLGHDGMNRTQKAAAGVDFCGSREILDGCISCAEGKQSRTAFKKEDVVIKTAEILELIHMDVCGPMSKSLGGAKYFLTFIDDYSRKVFVSFLSEKSAVTEAFREFKAVVEKQTGRMIKRLRSDNGTEFVNVGMKSICADAGIVHETTIPYTPQQNGVAERMNRTLVERARCMLSDADFEKSLWAEGVHHAAYLINRSVNRSIGERTPEEIWTGGVPNLSNLQIFGTPAMVHVPSVKRKKWDKKSIEMRFIGYADTQKGFRFFDPASGRIVISRDAKFLTPKAAKLGSLFVVDGDDSDSQNSVGAMRPVGEVQANALTEADESTGTQDNEASETDASDDEAGFQDAADDPDYVSPDGEQPVVAEPRRSTRVRKPVVRDGFISYFSRDCSSDDPSSREEAIKSHNGEKWVDAMKEELASFEANETWSLVDLPVGRKPIKTMWVFKTKRAEDGTVVRHKARLVAKGCSQIEGIDYGETFSPVVRYGSIRILIALAAQRGLDIDQMDAVSAYLQGTLNEDIYTRQPEGFDDGTGRVCKLHKAMYGLKQSGREWNRCLDAALLSFGLKKSDEDPCVYFAAGGDLIVAIYVDDFLIFFKDPTIRDELKLKLSTKFHMKDMGRARTCVGMTIDYERDFISISQETYANDVLKRFGMADCKSVGSPCDPSQKLISGSDELDGEADVPYREAVGSLLFLVQGTRPDLAFAVSNVSRFNDKHNSTHWVAVKRIMRYLRGTSGYRIAYRRKSLGPISGFVDADYGNEIEERRSFSGYVFLLAGGAITWSSKRQSTVAASSTEAEYMAMAYAAKEALWLVRVIQQFQPLDHVVMWCDNQSAMTVASRVAFSPRIKHVDIAYHFYRQHVRDGLIVLKYVASGENVADCLTKPVGKGKIEFGASGFGLMCVNGDARK